MLVNDTETNIDQIVSLLLNPLHARHTNFPPALAQIYHEDDTLITFTGTVRACDVVSDRAMHRAQSPDCAQRLIFPVVSQIIFVRKDYTDDLADSSQTCDIAPHLFTISRHSR